MMARRRREPWPLWKITATALMWVLVGAGLLWASLFLAGQSGSATQPAPPGPGPLPPGTPTDRASFSLANLVLMLSLVAWAMAVVFGGWILYRLYLKIPAWRRRQLFGRRR